MKKVLLTVCMGIVSLLLMSSTTADKPTIYTIGDSTMADYDPNTYEQQRGWAQMFPQFLVGDIEHKNAARNGRSSKSFYNEGLWKNVLSSLKEGDYVFIQFGHNDQKEDGGSGEVGTNPWKEYYEYLSKYVNETREKKATPILLTPVVRCYFSGNTITDKGAHNLSATEDSLLNYPRAMKAVARELKVDLVDHTALTKELAESFGASEAKSLIYIEGDNTHLSIVGATLYARLVVQDLIRQNILTDYLNSSPDLIINPTDLDFGNSYVSAYSQKAVTISGMDLSPANGELTLQASEGFTLSVSEDGQFEQTTTLAYTNGNLAATNIYIRFTPTEVKSYTGTVTVSNDSMEPKTINLTGNALSMSGGAEFIVHYPLTENSDAIIEGPIISLGESWSNMYMKNYAVPNSNTTWPEGIEAGKAQRNSIDNRNNDDLEEDQWPAEIDIVANRYIQFAITAGGEDKTFTIDSIGLYAGAAGGSGMAYRVMIDTDESFANAQTLENRPSNASNTMEILSYQPILKVNGEDTFYLRFYPWYSSLAKTKYLCLQNLVIKGRVSQKDDPDKMNEKEQSNLTIYPNPTKGILHLENLEVSKNSSLKIYSITGTKIIEKGITNINEVVDLSNTPAGTYIIKVSSESGISTYSFIKY